MKTVTKYPWERINPWLVEIPASAREDMLVPARIYVDDVLWERAIGDRTLDQLVNVATMPGISGLELIAQSRTRWPHIKCILASGYLDDNVERRITTEFKAGTLRKPYNVADAADLIQKMLATNRLDEMEKIAFS